jgi:hypothetical protein
LSTENEISENYCNQGKPQLAKEKGEALIQGEA